VIRLCLLQVLLGGPNYVEPRLLAAVRGLVATYQSEVDALTLEVLGSWDRPLNKQNEVRHAERSEFWSELHCRTRSCGVVADGNEAV
jgi:hypothetical protein